MSNNVGIGFVGLFFEQIQEFTPDESGGTACQDVKYALHSLANNNLERHLEELPPSGRGLARRSRFG